MAAQVSRKSFAITPNDGANLPSAINRLYATGAGTVKVLLAKDVAAITLSIGANQFLDDLSIVKVYSTGTTATGLIGFA